MDLRLKVLEADFDSGMDVPIQGSHGYDGYRELGGVG